MRILDAITKQLVARCELLIIYTNTIKRGLTIIKKLVLKQIDHEITITYYKYSSLKSEEVKLAKIVKAVNLKLRKKVKSKIIIIRKLSSRNIVLIIDLANTKKYLLKKIS